MIRALVVDDEAPARDRMIRLLQAIGDIEIVGQADNGLAALEAVRALRPELVFLDIEMPELGGLEVAQTLGGGEPAIIFVTAYDQYALKAFDAAAVDYLVKPVEQTRLTAAIEKARRSLASFRLDAPKLDALSRGRRPKRLAVRSGNKFAVFSPVEISAILAQDHYATILCGGKEFLSEDSLDELISRLDPDRFVRVHRGGIINLDFLKELEREGDRKYVAVLQDAAKTRVSVSRERLAELKQRLGLL